MTVRGPHSCVGFSLVAEGRDTLHLWCTGFSLWWRLLLVRAWVLGHLGFSSCGHTRAHSLWPPGSLAQAQELWCLGPSCSAGTWDRPRPGVEPVSPVLAGGLSTTKPPRKPSTFLFVFFCLSPKHPHSLERLTYTSILYKNYIHTLSSCFLTLTL